MMAKLRLHIKCNGSGRQAVFWPKPKKPPLEEGRHFYKKAIRVNGIAPLLGPGRAAPGNGFFARPHIK
jgi:hypothetical protein